MGNALEDRPEKGGRATTTSDLLNLQKIMGGYRDMRGPQVYRIFYRGYQNTEWLASWLQGVEGAEQEMGQKN
jgi:hypothetical protein